MIQKLYYFNSTPEHPVNITKLTQNTGNDSNDMLPEGVVWCEENSPYIGENACVTVRHKPSKKQKIAKSSEMIKPAENVKPITEMVKIQFNKKGIVEPKTYQCKPTEILKMTKPYKESVQKYIEDEHENQQKKPKPEVKPKAKPEAVRGIHYLDSKRYQGNN